VVGVYLFLVGILGYGPPQTGAAGNRALLRAVPQIPEDDLRAYLMMFSFFVCLVVTPLWARKLDKKAGWWKLTLITISFVVWAYTLGGPFVIWGVYYAIAASVFLALWSLAAPLAI
jgi:hypothetical protein